MSRAASIPIASLPIASLALLVAVLAFGPAPTTPAAHGQAVPPLGQESEGASANDAAPRPLREFVESLGPASSFPRGAGETLRRRVRREALAVYERNGWIPLWHEGGRPAERARQLVDALARASEDGLDPVAYGAEELGERLASRDPTPAAEDRRLLELDLALSEAFVAFAGDLAHGRVDPRTIDPAWHVARERESVDAALEMAFETGRVTETLESLRPDLLQYRRLRQEVARLRRLAEAGGWPTVPPGATLEPGEPAPEERLRRLAERLRASGDLTPTLRPAPPVAADGGDPADADAAPADRRDHGTNPPPRLVSPTEGDRAAAAQAPEIGAPRLPVDDGLNDDGLYDDGLASVVRRFQERHGLDPDGRVGPRTLEALNRPIEDAIRRLELSLERLRWLPRELEDRFVLVNLPAFQLSGWERRDPDDPAAAGLSEPADGPADHPLEITLRMRVIVGEVAHETPIFSDRMTHMVLNPTWFVPRSIAVDEILPQARRDPASLAARDYRLRSTATGAVVDPATVDWSSLSATDFPYRIEQRPGRQNSLGRIKFMFPNRFSIYLHDTPARSLFSQTDRDFSHGCIRVEHPLDLALWLLEGRDGDGDADGDRWTRERLEELLATGETHNVELPRPIPVHLLYWTAWVTADGTLHLRKDLYGHDADLDRALRERRPDSS